MGASRRTGAVHGFFSSLLKRFQAKRIPVRVKNELEAVMRGDRGAVIGPQ
jgi:hypothetical protein